MAVTVRPLAEADIEACRDLNRAAFAAFLDLPEPAAFRPGANTIGPRWRKWPDGGVVLEEAGTITAAALLARWGSVCVIGPLMVHPDHWGQGHARHLMDALVPIIDEGRFAFTGLWTHVHSPLHVRLYEQYGFAMQRITSIMSKAPAAGGGAGAQSLGAFSALDEAGRTRALNGARAVTEALFPGFDAGGEIRSIAAEGLGETLLLARGGGLAGFGCVHHGEGSEATRGQALIKFAAIRPGAGAAGDFRTLLTGCEAWAAEAGAERVIAGTNTGREGAYRLMQQAGFRTDANGIAMMRPATEGYNRPDVFAIDDWR